MQPFFANGGVRIQVSCKSQRVSTNNKYFMSSFCANNRFKENI